MKRTFRISLISTAISVFAVIVLGAIMRASLGNGCPDWPTCYGSWTMPPFSTARLDYLHRLLTLLSSLLLLWTLWQARRPQATVRYALWVGAGLMVLEVLLVGVAIVHAQTVWLSSVHMGLALALLAALLTALAASWGVSFSLRMPFTRLAFLTLASAFLLYVSGSLVAVTGATAACPDWPLCNGLHLPTDALEWLNMTHRALVLFAALQVGMLLWQAWRTQRSHTAILVSSTAAATLFISQALLGAQGFPPYLLVLHTATSTAVWGALALTAALSAFSGRTAEDARRDALAWRERTWRGVALDFLQTTKPIVVLLLLVTTYAGMVIGLRAWPDWATTFWTLLGGFLAAGGSGAINQYIDREDDRKMQRTQKRPIPAGRLSPAEGLAFGVGITLASFYLLTAFVNLLAALLSLAGIFYYVILYSLLLKKTTVQNIVIGGGAGAIPPLVGWAAATGSLTFPALLLFVLVFLWTPPHFWALAIVRRNDYARAGIPMLPVVRGEAETRWQVFVYTVELVVVTLLFPLMGLGGALYVILAAVLGLWLLGTAYRVWKGSGNKIAWKMYRYSNMYLAFILFALMIDRLLF